MEEINQLNGQTTETQQNNSASAEERRKRRAERIARIMKMKEALSVLPNSIVLLPHTEEGHILCYMAFWTEKLMWMMRRKLGVTVKPEKLTEHSEKIKEIINRLYVLTGFSEYSIETLHTDSKARVVNMRRSWVIAPRTPEGKYVALAVRVLDPMMVQLRATGNSTEVIKKVSEVAQILTELNKVLRNISSELLAIVPGPERDEVRYKTPRFVKRVLRLANLNQEGENNENKPQPTTE